jgi:hypothetical protein
MAIPQHRNDAAREAAPSVLWFRGRWIVLLVVSVAIGLGLFKALDLIDVPLVANLIVSALPIAGANAWVCLLVNGKAPSYASDLLDWLQFLLLERLFMAGIKEVPPVFGARELTPQYPGKEQ